MTKAGPGDKIKVGVWQLLIIALFFACWELISLSGIVFHRLLPSPWQVFIAAVELLRNGKFFSHLLYSLHQIFWGFGLGAGFGLIVGLVLGGNRTLGSVFEPLVLWLAPVPKIIIYPIFLWFLGIGNASRIAMGVASAFFPVVIYTASGVRQVKPVFIDAARLLGARRMQVASKIYLPAILPSLWLGLRLAAAVSLVGILLAETKLSQQGVGFLIIEYYNHFQITEMYAVLLLVFVVGIALNAAFGWLQAHVIILRQARSADSFQ